MAKTKQQKEEIVNQLADRIKDSKSVVVANFDGLTVNESQAFRQECKDAGVDVFSVKKTLLQIALKKALEQDVDTKEMKGSLNIALSQDEVSAAKLVKGFSKKHEDIEFQGGILEGQIIDIEELKKLADLPSREELLAKVVGSLNAPISGFVNVLAGNLRGLVNVLNAIKDNK